MTNRPIPRLMSPRLPLGRRWLCFCRSRFARDLRASTGGVFTTLAVLSSVVIFYVGIPAAYAVYRTFGGVA